MKYYFTFSGNRVPGRTHYMKIVAPCEEAAINRVQAMGYNNWSTVYTHIRFIRRIKLIEYKGGAK